MIDEEKLYNLLSTLGYPVAYSQFKDKKVSIPFILYKNDATDTFKADDKTYLKSNDFIITLVTSKKDLQVELKLESLLNENNLPFDKNEDYIEGEDIYQIQYFI